MPSQGVCTTYGELRVHTQPAAQSPSFLTIKNGEKFTVLTHLITPRTDVPRPPLVPKAPKKQPRSGPKKKEPKIPPVPMPKPPPPPENWLELSKSDPGEEEPKPEEHEEKVTPLDNWSLVRTADGQSGWVLTRRLVMSIPDEVAQYAERKRIVSYFSLGVTEDEDQKKNIWLWTTINGVNMPYDFDSFRVFIWSLRRHRYETAYIQRNLEGFGPVLVHDVEYGTPTRGRTAATSKYPGFSLCVTKQDGQRYRQEFALLGNVVRLAGEHACEAAAPLGTVTPATPLPGAGVAETPPPAEGWWQRAKKRLRSITHH
jgi:hypothetical protein